MHVRLGAIVVASVVGALLGYAVCLLAERGAQGALVSHRRMARFVSLACGAVLLGLVVWLYGLTAKAVQYALFSFILLHLSLVDVDRRVIPNADLGLAVAVRLVYLEMGARTGEFYSGDVQFYFFGAFVMFVVMLATVLVADFIFKAESMGGGDLKLLVVVALYMGWLPTFFMLGMACVFGLITAVPSIVHRVEGDAGSVTFPFGPSIALATLLWLFVVY